MNGHQDRLDIAIKFLLLDWAKLETIVAGAMVRHKRRDESRVWRGNMKALAAAGLAAAILISGCGNGQKSTVVQEEYRWKGVFGLDINSCPLALFPLQLHKLGEKLPPPLSPPIMGLEERGKLVFYLPPKLHKNITRVLISQDGRMWGEGGGNCWEIWHYQGTRFNPIRPLYKFGIMEACPPPEDPSAEEQPPMQSLPPEDVGDEQGPIPPGSF